MVEFGCEPKLPQHRAAQLGEKRSRSQSDDVRPRVAKLYKGMMTSSLVTINAKRVGRVSIADDVTCLHDDVIV